MAYELKDYREVAERINIWYERHHDGRIETSIIENTDARVTMRAEVYRGMDPAEPPAGTGHSFLDKPGKTPYTKDSELENAETSAVGRALVMAGIPSKSVASTSEVASKGEPYPPTDGLPTSTAARIQELVDIGGDTKAVVRAKRLLRERLGTDDFQAVPDEEWENFLAAFIELETVGA